MSQDKGPHNVYGPPQPGSSSVPPPPGFIVGPQTVFMPPPYSQGPRTASYPPAAAAAAAYGQQPGYHHPGPPPAYHNAFTPHFEDVAVRKAFIRKVFLILAAQLLVTFNFVAAFTYSQDLRFFVMRNPWMMTMSLAVYFVTVILLSCCGDFRRRPPGNMIALSLLTLSMSFMAGVIASSYRTEIVIMAVGITAVVCVCVVLFSLQTKYDFTLWSGAVFISALVLMLVGVLSIFMASRFLHIVYAAMGALFFTFYLAFDTQRLLHDKQLALGTDDYVFAAVCLYIDIVQIFLFILRLFGLFQED